MYSQSYYSVLKSFGISFCVGIQQAGFRIRFICFILFLGIAFLNFNFVTCPLIPDYVLHFYSLDYIINYSLLCSLNFGQTFKGNLVLRSSVSWFAHWSDCAAPLLAHILKRKIWLDCRKS